MRAAEPSEGPTRRAGHPLLTGLLGGLLLLSAGCGPIPFAGLDHRTGGRDDQRTAPFDGGRMARTLQPTATGGIEQVVARDPAQVTQLEQVRAHLLESAALFQQGRYEDPARLHGMVMPGSKELESGYARVQVDLAELPSGGQLTFTTSDQGLVQALHSWFERRQMGG